MSIITGEYSKIFQLNYKIEISKIAIQIFDVWRFSVQYMNLYKIHLSIPFSLCSFKRILTEVTCSNEKALCFLQHHGVLIRKLLCTGPAIKGKRRFGCGKEMTLKSTKDTKDGLVWQCRKIHKIDDSGEKKVTKDVKITV